MLSDRLQSTSYNIRSLLDYVHSMGTPVFHHVIVVGIRLCAALNNTDLLSTVKASTRIRISLSIRYKINILSSSYGNVWCLSLAAMA